MKCGRAAGQFRHARVTVDARRARVPRGLAGRSARGRDAAPAVVADPARHHPARASARQREEIRRHLDAAKALRSPCKARRCVADSRRRCVPAECRWRSPCSTPAAPRLPMPSTSLREAGAEGILVIPMFPQYCGASTGAVFDQVSAALRSLRARAGAEIRRRAITTTTATSTRSPRACRITAASIGCRAPSADVVPWHSRALRQRSAIRIASNASAPRACWRSSLGLAADAWSVSFQSRFGRARWLQPYTSEVLAELARARHRQRERDLPGIRGRLPRDARGDRHGESRRVPGGGRRDSYHYIAALNARAGPRRRAACTGAA